MEQVCADHAPVIITRKGEQPVVMMSMEDYRALEALLHRTDFDQFYLRKFQYNGANSHQSLTKACPTNLISPNVTIFQSRSSS